MTLRDDILANPDCAEALERRDCAELARLASIGRTRVALVEIADVQAALQRSGAWWAIKAVAPGHPAYAAAVAVMDVGAARYTNLDTTLPLVGQMFGALVATSVIDQTVMDEIIALGVKPDPVTARDCAVACFNDDGTPI